MTSLNYVTLFGLCVLFGSVICQEEYVEGESEEITDQLSNNRHVKRGLDDFESAVVFKAANIALKRPAIQSSTWFEEGAGAGVAGRAVDGNRNPDLLAKSCSCTQGTYTYGLSWWAVDLRIAWKVRRVRITNRLDCCAERLSNFDIGLTNVSPWLVAPDISHSSRCAYRQHPPASYEMIDCDPHIPPRRYLFIKKRDIGFLQLCEVEVFIE